jgi:ArsR family transcriptional regulator, lead/cadmium/zinc/bismuth-responsive transcriptional repressor
MFIDKGVSGMNSESDDTTTDEIKKLQEINDSLPDEDALYDLAELFKIFGDSTRIKILFTLLVSELSVNCIADILHMTQSAVSHQLRILKSNGLVKYERKGKSLIYSLADNHVTSILNQGLDHIAE